ncbi:MAG: diaminopimelate epimerase [Stappiaceae bacterium]
MGVNGIPFLKMNGLGNNFVVFDSREPLPVLSREQIAMFARDINFDQMITLEKSPLGVDLFMRINNADGSEVSACGNATRCIGRLLMEENGAENATIQTNAGLLYAYKTEDPQRITVDMGTPKLGWEDIPLSEEFRDTRAIELQIGPIDDPILDSPSVVNMGNPHAIFWVEDVNGYDMGRIGPLLEFHPIFPEKANISIAAITGQNELTLRVWERGVGLTKACGTAACAAGVAAVRKNFKQLPGRKNTIILPGGPLEIEWRQSDEHVLMTGDTEFEFEGVLDPETLSWERIAA